MNKIKTLKSAAKRIKITGSGKLKHGRVGMRHNSLSAPRRRSKQRTTVEMNSTKRRSVMHLMPYGGIF